MRLRHCITQRGEPLHSCHLQLQIGPITVDTIPSESSPFTPSSILYRPRHNPLAALKRTLVEAPGTAPGSDGFITMAVYRHS